MLVYLVGLHGRFPNSWYQSKPRGGEVQCELGQACSCDRGASPGVFLVGKSEKLEGTDSSGRELSVDTRNSLFGVQTAN